MEYLSARSPMTALGGALVRDIENGWRWSDGTGEPRLRDMRLNDLAPNFRCRPGHVEVPHDWRKAKYWLNHHVDDDARAAIQDLLQEAGSTAAPIYAEGWAEMVDDHRLAKSGYLIPIGLWEATMSRVVGCWWDKSDEADILDRARALEDS